jgi:ribose/xylose/arabinose/galactoside ABC-type transport system permease subunit
MQGVLAVGVAFLFVLPLNNIQRIVTTEGEDITQFRQMIRDLQTAFLGLQVSFILFIIVTIIGYFYVARQLLNLN